MFDSELIRRFHCLSLAARRVGGRSLIAAPPRRLPGGGTEATGRRDYAPGDDYRYVDWTWCARRDELLTKVFEGDEDRSVYILLDCSPSMGLGTPPKFHLARQIAAMLGFQTLTELARLGMVAFSEGIVAHAPPMRDRSRLPLLLRFVGQLSLQGKATDLRRTAEAFVRRHQRPGPVVVISDLYDRGDFRQGFDLLLGHGYQPRLVQIHDPAEARPAMLGDLELFDVESGVSRQVTVTERARQRYMQLFAEFHRSVRSYCARRGIPRVQLAGDATESEVLLEVLGARPASAGGLVVP